MNRLPAVRIASSRLLLVPLVSAVAVAQTYPIWTFDGVPAGGIGRSVANAGDVDGDGIPDSVLGGTQIVRVHSGASGALVHSLLPPSPLASGYGTSFAGVGDLNGDGRSEFVVGAPLSNSVSLVNGEAFVYSGSTGAILFTFTGGGGQQLGRSVAGPGDVNLDGVPDVLAAGSGLVRLFSGANGSILVSLSGLSPQAVATGVGDFNADGLPDFAVGQPGSPGFPPLASGPVTLRSGGGGGVLLTIPPPSSPGTADFGAALAAAGDVNGDGVGDLIVGQTDVPLLGGPVGPGIARVYSGATAALLFTFPGSATGDAFGCSVAGPRDLDGDGIPDILVGARQGASLPGYARAFSGATGSLILTMSGATAGDGFGTAVASGGDPNGDGVPDFIVGAPGADPGGATNAGQVRVLSFVGIPPTGTILGTGCPGSGSSVPRISISGGTPNSAGNPAIAVHLSNALGGTVAALIVGFNATSWLGIPLPADLGILGIPGCSLRVSADVILVTTTNGAGRAVFPHPTPSDPALSGATVYYQWFVVDPGPALLPGALSAGLQLGVL